MKAARRKSVGASLFLATLLSACGHLATPKLDDIKKLTDNDIALWMLNKVGEKVCIRAKIVGTYRFLSFHMDPALADQIGPYTGHVYTTITQRYAVEHGIDFGETISVCGKLVFDWGHDPKNPPELHSYVIEDSTIIKR